MDTIPSSFSLKQGLVGFGILLLLVLLYFIYTSGADKDNSKYAAYSIIGLGATIAAHEFLSDKDRVENRSKIAELKAKRSVAKRANDTTQIDKLNAEIRDLKIRGGAAKKKKVPKKLVKKVVKKELKKKAGKKKKAK